MISPGQRSMQHLLEACKSLAILYDACRQLNRRNREDFLSLSEFYNEDLSLKMDFKKEYEHWRNLNSTKRYRQSPCKIVRNDHQQGDNVNQYMKTPLFSSPSQVI